MTFFFFFGNDLALAQSTKVIYAVPIHCPSLCGNSHGGAAFTNFSVCNGKLKIGNISVLPDFKIFP